MKSFKLGVDRFLLALFLGFLLAALAVIWDSQTIDRIEKPARLLVCSFFGLRLGITLCRFQYLCRIHGCL